MLDDILSSRNRNSEVTHGRWEFPNRPMLSPASQDLPVTGRAPFAHFNTYSHATILILDRVYSLIYCLLHLTPNMNNEPNQKEQGSMSDLMEFSPEREPQRSSTPLSGDHEDRGLNSSSLGSPNIRTVEEDSQFRAPSRLCYRLLLPLEHAKIVMDATGASLRNEVSVNKASITCEANTSPNAVQSIYALRRADAETTVRRILYMTYPPDSSSLRSLRLLVDNPSASRIIGPKGDSIVYLRQSHNVSLHIFPNYPPHCDERVVSVEGTFTGLRHALRALWSYVKPSASNVRLFHPKAARDRYNHSWVSWHHAMRKKIAQQHAGTGGNGWQRMRHS